MVRYLTEEERDQVEAVSAVQKIYRLNTAERMITGASCIWKPPTGDGRDAACSSDALSRCTTSARAALLFPKWEAIRAALQHALNLLQLHRTVGIQVADRATISDDFSQFHSSASLLAIRIKGGKPPSDPGNRSHRPR